MVPAICAILSDLYVSVMFLPRYDLIFQACGI